MNLVFLGPPGAGKGVQAKKIAKKLGIAHISTGDILRAELAAGTELGAKARKFIESGQLVPDDLVISMVERRLSEAVVAEGFILDGFPRTKAQAQELNRTLSNGKAGLDAVVNFQLPDEIIVERLSARRTCSKCGENYNLATMLPKQEGICDKCGGELIRRPDDEPDTVKERLAVYHDQTAPLVGFYKEKGILQEVDASGTADEVFGGICSVVDA